MFKILNTETGMFFSKSLRGWNHEGEEFDEYTAGAIIEIFNLDNAELVNIDEEGEEEDEENFAG
jgi:hypothetical protein